MKNGLYANINAKRNRIKAQKAAGKTPERMRKVGSKGAPTKAAFVASAKTAKPVKPKKK
jgi:hypothetical protein